MTGTVLSPKHVGEALFRFRRRAGWTQEELALKTGINESSISRYEQGKNRIGKANFKKLCIAFTCSPEHFLRLAWEISEEENSGVRFAVTPEFPAAELERIYDDFASLVKSLFMQTCRVVFDTSQKANAPPPKDS
jgi:transcriptional regulator with XRE-family HTH domain